MCHGIVQGKLPQMVDNVIQRSFHLPHDYEVCTSPVIADSDAINGTITLIINLVSLVCGGFYTS